MIKEIKKYLISKGFNRVAENGYVNQRLPLIVELYTNYNEKAGVFVRAGDCVPITYQELFSFWAYSFEDFVLKYELLNADDHVCEFCEGKQYLKKSTICEICRKKLGE